MLNWLRRLRARRIPPRIELAPDGFVIVGPNGEREAIRWFSIKRIAAWKRDLLTTDEIIISIEIDEHPGMVWDVSEEWTGFHNLFKPMQEHLGIAPTWVREVMLPAFAVNWRMIYERGEPANSRPK